MTLEELTAYFDSRSLRVHLMRNIESYYKDSSRWSCSVEGTHDGVELRVHVLGATALDACTAAYEKFKPHEKVVPSNRILEHKPEHDDIPF